MKMITIIIRPERLHKVHKALQDIGIEGITCVEVKGVGKQKGKREIYRGSEVDVAFVDKIKLEIVVNTTPIDKVIDVVLKNARSKKNGTKGAIGDGKIFITNIDEVVRIRTGERNEEAL